MLRFFDYFYYLVHKMFARSEHSSPEFAASCMVSGIEGFNILSAKMLYDVFMNRHPTLSKGFNLSVIIGLIILNYFRYIQIRRFSFENIGVKWDAKREKSKSIIKYLIGVYVCVSILILGCLILNTYNN